MVLVPTRNGGPRPPYPTSIARESPSECITRVRSASGLLGLCPRPLSLIMRRRPLQNMNDVFMDHARGVPSYPRPDDICEHRESGRGAGFLLGVAVLVAPTTRRDTLLNDKHAMSGQKSRAKPRGSTPRDRTEALDHAQGLQGHLRRRVGRTLIRGRRN